MTLSIQQVPLEFVNRVWPSAEEYLKNAFDFAADDYTVDDARVYVASGMWSLIVALDEEGVVHGAAVVTYYNRPRSRVAYIMGLGGRLVTNKNTCVQLYDIFRRNGADSIEAAARDAVLPLWKKYGLTKKYTIISTMI